MSFFKQFPTKEYDTLSTGQLQTLIDISRAVDVNDILAEDSVAYTKYNIIDGARPDIVSQLLYNTPEYYWTFFIVNDHLKDGYRAWPKSEVALEKYIDENYNMVIMESPTANNWSFNRFPLNQYLSIYDKDDPQQRIYFKEYDEKTFCLKFQRTNSTHFQKIIDRTTGGAPNISWPEFVNPHNVFSEEYQEVEKIRKQWNIDFFNYMQTISSTQIAAYLAGAFPDDNTLTPGTDAYYQRFADYMVSDEIFTSYTKFYNEKNATHHFLDDQGERVSGYNAFYSPLRGGRYNNNPDRVTITEYENTLNDSRQEIKVIRPERIDEFARRFKELINE
jgi:hypothetical protein